MLDEGRKRDAAANAVLALSFAANAAQSPQSLVSSGKVEAPGVAGMQRLMDPRKKRKDLDLQRVSHSARNKLRTETYDDDMFRQHSKERPIDDQGYTPKSRTSSFLKKMKDLNLSQEPTKKKKKKTFKEFVEEAYLDEKNVHGIPDEVEAEWKADRAAGKPGSRTRTHGGQTYLVRSHARAGKPKTWAISTASRRGAEEKKRKKAEEEGQLTHAELLHATGGNREKADLAYDAEQSGIARHKSRTKRIQKTTGVRQSSGHKKALQPKKPSHEDPGHTLSNLMTQRHQPNVAQQNRETKPGEPGYSLTRNQSVQDALKRGASLERKIDKLRDEVVSGKPSREANLYVKLKRLKNKKKKAEGHQ